MRRSGGVTMPTTAAAIDPLLNPGVMDIVPPSPSPAPRRRHFRISDNNTHTFQHQPLAQHEQQPPLPILMDWEIEDYLLPAEVDAFAPRAPTSSIKKQQPKHKSKRISSMGAGAALPTPTAKPSVIEKVKSWQKELWDSVLSKERVLTRKAEETHRELSAEALDAQSSRMSTTTTKTNTNSPQSAINKPHYTLQVAPIESEQRRQERAISEEKERMVKFFEVYKSHRDRRLRAKMDKLKKEIEQNASAIVEQACREGSSDGQVGALNDVEVYQRFSELAGKTAGALDKLENEFATHNYNHLVAKLKGMVIHEAGPKSKRSRTQELTEEQLQEEESEGPRRRVHTVYSLTQLCIATCAKYVDYLPELPDDCFPAPLVQNLLHLLIQQQKISDQVLHNLLGSSMLALSLDQCKQLTPASLNVVAFKCGFLHTVSFKDCPTVSNDGIAAITNGCPNLETINLEGCVQVDDEGVTCIARKCSVLCDLSLAHCPKVTDLAVQELILRCPQLARIILRKCSQITDGAFTHIANCAELRDLDVYDCAQISDKTLCSLVHCKKLHTLRILGRQSQVTDTGVSALTNSCYDLRVLELVNCDITDRSVHSIGLNCPELRCLNVSQCRHLTNNVLNMETAKQLSEMNKPFPGVPVYLGSNNAPHQFLLEEPSLTSNRYFGNLARLDLSRCTNLGDDTLEHIAMYISNLKRLNLSGCEGVTDAGILALARSSRGVCRNLHHFAIAKSGKRVTDFSLAEFFKCCRGLRVVNLENCNAITNATAISLAQNCANLVDIDLTACENIDDEGLQWLALSCPNVESVSLEELTLLTPAGIALISRWHGLRSLRLAYCTKGVTDDCLATIAEGCPLLRNLDLSYCNHADKLFDVAHLFTAVLPRWSELETLHLRGINAFTNQSGLAHPRLQTLNLSWCKYLEDEALEAIGMGCPQLSSIDLAWCGKLTGAAIHRVAQRSPHLRSFNLRGCTRVPTLTVNLLTHAGKMVYR